VIRGDPETDFMSAKRPLPPRPLPGWLILAATALVAFHLLAISVHVLAAPSGPWWVNPIGPSQALGPMFAGKIEQVTTRYYLQPLQMTHNYHFLGNRPDAPGIFVEVRLKDASGRLIDTVRFPSAKDNPWLKVRHTMLAAHLGDDEPVQAQGPEQIAAPGHKAKTVKIWEGVAPNKTVLHDVQTHLVPKGPPVFKPRDWSLILARSYARNLCREYGAASAEVTRHSRPPIMPAILFLEEAPPGTFDTLVSTFEEYHSEK
jgi:hypothetical protein